jgi:hypothetical protein
MEIAKRERHEMSLGQKCYTHRNRVVHTGFRVGQVLSQSRLLSVQAEPNRTVQQTSRVFIESRKHSNQWQKTTIRGSDTYSVLFHAVLFNAARPLHTLRTTRSSD